MTLDREGYDVLITDFYDAVHYIFSTYTRSKPHRKDSFDQETRTPQFTKKLLNQLGSPDQHGTTIKVTGSKGKGSTARLLAGILQAHQIKTGLFTSPHLIDFTERIRVQGRAIDEADFMRLLTRVKPFADEIDRCMQPHEYFGPVGLTAVVAALYFLEQQTQMNVVELGRGARFDDVNQWHGEYGVITPIHFEHAKQLGPTLADIAWNKAGIFTPGMKKAFLSRQVPEVERVLTFHAKEQGVEFLQLGRDMTVESVQVTTFGTLLTIKTPYAVYENVELSLYGRHQADNLAVAVAAAEAIMNKPCDKETLQAFAKRCTFYGRMQLVIGNEKRPDVFVDGAIHREAAQSIAQVVRLIRDERQIQSVITVIGVPQDKDYVGVIEEASQCSSRLILTKAKNPSLHFTEDAVRVAKSLGDARYIDTLPDALQDACDMAGPNGLVIVLGTQSIVAEALAYLDVDTRHL